MEFQEVFNKRYAVRSFDKSRKIEKEVQALLDKNVPLISNLANTASFLYESLKDINWVGFYLVDEEKKYLYLGL